MRTLTTLGCAAVIGAAALTGCGSSDDSGGSASGGGAGSDVSAENVQYAKDQIAKYSAVPKFESDAEPIDVSSLKGKTVYSIPITTSIPFYKDGEAAMAAAAKKAGVTYVTFPSQGKVSDFQQGFSDAINAKASVIILNGPLPDTLQPQIRAAEKAGVKIIAAHEEDPTSPTPKGVDAVAAGEFYNAARLMVDKAIADQNGKPVKALAISADETRPSKGMVAAMKDELAKRCGSKCSLTVTNVPVADWATKVQPQVQSELNRDGEINTILPIYDSMAQYTDPAIRQAARGRTVNVYSFNGTPSINALMQKGGSNLKMNVGESPTLIGLLTMDQAFRLMLGKKPLDKPTAPLRVFTPENVDEAGTPPVSGKGFGDVDAGYDTLWGLK
ncbi:sugar ABC transporter substrate-binding protein [Patulibacter sp. SYSU D01012]|uniref:sugar ABC transporter substrate-binding protein n=1 Tax=Patulibacter sp. SYSU D01012 TaxID=2817381 RepID=UPI001B30C12C|nr:sugar ABC transporter substrate-binding protein [Patulibacter sp. SYSU D01012]